MVDLLVHPAEKPLNGTGQVPGDKSISHRSLMFAALADGDSHITHFLPGGDCHATLGCLRGLGIKVDQLSETELIVHGCGIDGLKTPEAPLNCVRSGTTMRLMTGILAGQPFDCVLTGEEQLARRPMKRVTEPLGEMGAFIETTNGCAPLIIHGRQLHGCDHYLKIASAQVKSALILAGLFAKGETVIVEPGPARDHTERMLGGMGADIQVCGQKVVVKGGRRLTPLQIQVPGDFSSAAFLLAAAVLVPGSSISLENVNVNQTRTGLMDVLQAMGAVMNLSDYQEVPESGNEPNATILVQSGSLRGAEVGGETVVRMIDEFPVLAVAATQAQGQTIVRDAQELRVKETDRIATVVEELTKMGASIEALPDGFVVEGPTRLQGGKVSSHGDHRLAMALAVAGLVAQEDVLIEDTACMSDSFPGFIPLMQQLGARYD